MADTRPMQRAQVVGAAVLILAMWAALALALRGRPPGVMQTAISLAHALTGAMLIAAAALQYAAWRITGTTSVACSVLGLAVMGVMTPILGIATRAAKDGIVHGETVDLAAGLAELAVLGCVIAAVALPPVVARLKPLRLTTPLIAGCVLIAGVVFATGSAEDAGPRLRALIAAIRITDVGLWLTVAIALMTIGARRGATRTVAVGAVLLIPATGSAARATVGAVRFHSTPWTVGLYLLIACIVVGAATVHLCRLHTGQGTRFLAVKGELRCAETDLGDARADLADLESEQARRLHDARNAIFAIAGATALLARSDRSTDPEADRLQGLVSAELDRLGHLLDPAFRSTVSRFTARELLSPLVRAYRGRGVDIALTIAPDAADQLIETRREALVNALSNVLTNARVHAPGARIWVSVGSEYDEVAGLRMARIAIADDGPGIPAAERTAVLRPGVRGSQAAAGGSGLGLASAAQALAEAGGALRITERPGGGTVVTLLVPGPRTASIRATAPSSGSVPNAGQATAHRTAKESPAERHPVAIRQRYIVDATSAT